MSLDRPCKYFRFNSFILSFLKIKRPESKKFSFDSSLGLCAIRLGDVFTLVRILPDGGDLIQKRSRRDGLFWPWFYF